MIVPLNTDAPIYYRPIGTIGLILLNCLVFAYTLTDPYAIERWGLPHGEGFTPLAWVTSNFIHGGLFHLLGNMVFLWGFGLVVEGKLGWQRFVPIYFAIGVLECALEQALFRHDAGVSFGASAIIFGLMIICLIWAPKNDLTVFYWFFFRAGFFDLPIVWFAALMIAKSMVMATMFSSGETLHLLGGAIGAAIGFAMLATRQVDCEGWDLISWLGNRLPNTAETLSQSSQADLRRRAGRQNPHPSNTPTAPEVASALCAPPNNERFFSLLNHRKPQAAFAELVRIRHLRPEWTPGPSELLALARGLRKAHQWDDAVESYRNFLHLRPDFGLARLEVAEIIVLVLERPAAARRLLEGCDPESLSPLQRQKYEQLQERIQSLIDSGVLEIEGGAWS